VDTRKKIVTVKAGLNLSGFDGALNNYADAGYVLHTVLYVKNAGYVLAVMTLREDCGYDLKPEFVGVVPEHNDYDGAVLREAIDTRANPSDTVSEQVADIVSEPVADMVSEPVADMVSEPVADIVSEPVADIVSEPVADMVSEPVAGAMEVVPAEETDNVPNAEDAAAILGSSETADLSTLADLNDLNSGEPETN